MAPSSGLRPPSFVLAFSSVRAQSGLPDPLYHRLERWLLWNVPQLDFESRIEWSPRLTRVYRTNAAAVPSLPRGRRGLMRRR